MDEFCGASEDDDPSLLVFPVELGRLQQVLGTVFHFVFDKRRIHKMLRLIIVGTTALAGLLLALAHRYRQAAAENKERALLLRIARLAANDRPDV